MRAEEGIKIGSYDVLILESVRNKDNGLEFFPVLMDAFDGDIWKGKNRVYVSKTMTDSELYDLLQSNPFVVEQLFGMEKNQKVTLIPVVDIIKHS